MDATLTVIDIILCLLTLSVDIYTLWVILFKEKKRKRFSSRIFKKRK